MRTLRHHRNLVLFLTLLAMAPAMSIREAAATDCQGETWRKVAAWAEGHGNLAQTVAFLKDQGLAFDSRELADEFYEKRVKEYLAQGIEPGCVISATEWLPLEEGEIECFPFATRTSEITHIDFDANDAFIELTCSSAIVKMSCEAAKALGQPGARWPVEPEQEAGGSLGLPLPPHTDCAAVRNLN